MVVEKAVIVTFFFLKVFFFLDIICRIDGRGAMIRNRGISLGVLALG